MKRGFTLIELLVVITILAILAGAALPYIQAYVEESRVAKAKADLEEIARALAVYETREGDYPTDDVSQLTGRYLNKAPIDPWGKQYVVATISGTVYSGGPDRDPSKEDDNIVVPYQPPIALVQVKWLDRNNSGAVDAQNTPDQIQMVFSRMLLNDTAFFSDVLQSEARLNAFFQLSSHANFCDQFASSTAKVLDNGKVLVLEVRTTTVPPATYFTAGSDTIQLKDGHGNTDGGVQDVATNLCIASQVVKILPQ